MIEHVADYEWHGEGEGAEVVLYAPDPTVARWTLEQALPAARLPGVASPVYAASSSHNPQCLGWVTTSETHIAPNLISAPGWGLLLVADAHVESMGAPIEASRQIGRRLSEVALPNIGEAGVRRVAELGAVWVAEKGLIEEDDLPLLGALAGDADALGRRALSGGLRDWTRPGGVSTFKVVEILDSDGAGQLGLESGSLALIVRVGAEDLGRISLSSHRERISIGTSSGAFGAPVDLPAAPLETEEARDLVAAVAGAANYAAGRAALVVYALRQVLQNAGGLSLRAAWRTGGLEEQDEWVLHRNGLAAVGAEQGLVTGRIIAAGTGEMLDSAPPFETLGEDGRWIWEEAGVLMRWVALEPLGQVSGEFGG